MAERRFTLNAYELLLLQKIIVIEYEIMADSPSPGDFERIGNDLGVDPGTVAKFFNRSSNINKPSFNRDSVNILIGKLGLGKIQVWESFKAAFAPPAKIFGKKFFIPIGHLGDLSDQWKTKIVEAVKLALVKIYPEKDITSLSFDFTNHIVVSEVPLKMKKLFLNTAWYLYFYHEQDYKPPKIGRAILRIGNSIEDVEITNIPDGHSTDYIGVLSCDLGQKFLYFNGTTKNTSEKYYHMKVLINTDRISDLMLGHASNAGKGGYSIVYRTVILENQSDKAFEELEAQIIGPDDNEFDLIHPGIRKYFQYRYHNFHKTKTNIYSHDTLEEFVDNYGFGFGELAAKKMKRIRSGREYKALITSPKYSISKEEIDGYAQPIKIFATSLERDLGISVIHYTTQKRNSGRDPMNPYEYYIRRVKKCDILIVFIFHQVMSSSLLEISWAVAEEKPIFIFAKNDDYIPRIIREYNISFIRYNTDFNSCREAVDYLMKEKLILFSPYAKNENEEA